MSLTVITEAEHADEPRSFHNNTNGHIVLESDLPGPEAIEELQGTKARELAIQEAARMGLPDPRINGSVETFAIDADKRTVKDYARQEATGFRGIVPVTRRLA